jgi:FtsZ-binding cell division protein ZapB
MLQQHIDELTTEKLELLRGLQQQARSNEALAEENRSLEEQHNQMAMRLQAEQAAAKRLESEVEAVAASMAALVGERDAHRAAATEASERANVSGLLAAEICMQLRWNALA